MKLKCNSENISLTTGDCFPLIKKLERKGIKGLYILPISRLVTLILCLKIKPLSLLLPKAVEIYSELISIELVEFSDTILPNLTPGRVI